MEYSFECLTEKDSQEKLLKNYIDLKIVHNPKSIYKCKFIIFEVEIIGIFDVITNIEKGKVYTAIYKIDKILSQDKYLFTTSVIILKMLRNIEKRSINLNNIKREFLKFMMEILKCKNVQKIK